MLSELYHLSKNVAKSQGTVESKHPDCDEPGLSGYTNLRLLIGNGGSIINFGVLEPSDIKGENYFRLWTLTHIFRKKRNRVYFPSIRIRKPLIRIEPESEVWKKLESSPIQTLGMLLDENPLQPIELEDERCQAERITQWQHDESATLAPLVEFAYTFLEFTKDGGKMAILLSKAIKESMAQTEDKKIAAAFQTLVCGDRVTSKHKPPKIECKIQVVFDYRPQGELSGILYSQLIQRIVIDCLKKEIKTDDSCETQSRFSCAFAGSNRDAGPPLKASFTKWPAKPVFGMPFYAFSKNTYTSSGAPCNARYRRGDADSFPIGSETANRLVEFSSSMTTPEMHETTWKGIRNGKFEGEGKKKRESQDVLIAYPSFKFDELVPVSIFARPSRKEETSGDPDDEVSHISSGTAHTGFKQVAESYIRSLKEKVPEKSRNKNHVHLLLLRAITSGQVQLVYSASPTCVEFDAALDCWMNSESYLPERMLIPLPSKKAEDGLGWFRPRLLFPEEAIRTYTHQWKRGGSDSNRIQAPPVGDIFNVFLRRDGVWEKSASELLEVLIPRVEPLLTAAGRRLHLTHGENLKDWNEFLSRDAQYCLSQSLSFIGTLLHALNPHHQQEYMKETAYQLGRLLAAMDHLHKCYCDGERGGSYPPTLIGNGLLGRTADSPQEALAELCERGRIYLGWAQTSKPLPISEGLPEDKAKAAKKQRNAVYRARDLFEFIDPLCGDIHENADLENPMCTQDKAHLFLGYLTEVPRKKWEDRNPTSTNESTIEQQNQSE